MNTHDIELADEVLEKIIRESRNSDGTLEFARRIYRAAIEADRKLRGEPVASIYITESGEREFDDWRVPLPTGRTELFAAPQPAEPVKVPSDAEILDELQSHGALATSNAICAVRALLARYATPASN